MYYIVEMILISMLLPGTLELFTLSFGALLASRRKQIKEKLSTFGKLAIIIPSHNEEEGIIQTLKSLNDCTASADIIVIAHNCTDKTAELARHYSTEVLEYNDPKKKGKPHALSFAFRFLQQKSYDHYLIIDADSTVTKNLIEEVQIAFSMGAQAIQTKYRLMLNDPTPSNRLARLAFDGINWIRPLGRQQLSLSAGILGNGFAISRQVLDRVPFPDEGLVEDTAYHLSLVLNDVNVKFLTHAEVLSDIPKTKAGLNLQRARWEGGRFRLIYTTTGSILKKVFTGKWRLIEPLFDLWTLPLSYHAMLIFFLMFLNPIFGTVALCVLGFHLGTIFYVCKAEKADYLALLSIPLFVVRKILSFRHTLNTVLKNSWERTPRS